MAIDWERLRNWPFEPVEQSYGVNDTILYALAVGCGGDPTDRADLRFVYEEGLQALPTMGVILAYPGFWLKDPRTGVDWRRLLHGEQGLILHRPLPAVATVVGRTRVTGALDKGPGKGALLFLEREVLDKASGEPLCTLTATTFLRGDGGSGGPSGTAPRPHPLPGRAPDTTLDLATLPQAALLYRLCGDANPLHADPEVAAAAGFSRPILHGLCTFAVAGRAILAACCDNDPARLKQLQVRFSAPVFPGETIRTEIWRDGAEVSFRSSVVEREAVVLNNGYALTVGAA